MKATIDAAGRVVIPREIRRQAGLEAGTALEVRWNAGRIEIEPASVPVALVREGRFLVAVPHADGPALTTRAVEAMRDTIANEHERGP